MTLALLAADYQSVLHPAGPYAETLEKLWWSFLIICGAAWIIVVIALALATIHGTRRPVPDVTEEGIRGGMKWLTIAVTTTTVLLVAMLITSVAAGRDVSPVGEKSTREIEIKGHQWWWEVRYLSMRPDEIAEDANELHLPAGERVRFILTSSDVIHSFWIPNLHGKRDLIPGKKAIFTLRADKPGIYRAQCAEFCGMQHANMGFVVIVQPRAEFERWLTRQRAPAPHPKTAEQQRGQQVFLMTTCAMCHSIKGTQAGARTGPDLTHLGSRRTLGAAILQNNRGNLHGWIANAQSLKPGVLMPPHSFDTADLHALVAYLESLK